MRLIFMGSPDVVLKPLSTLHRDAKAHGHDLIAVVSQPPKPVGRSKTLQDPPVAAYAKEHNIHTLQPESSKDEKFVNDIRELKPDVVITAAYGQILNHEFLSIPSRATINIHPSLLPKYRGATPVQTSLLNGDIETGVTILFTVKKLDAGPIIIQEKTSINQDETAIDLLERLFARGGEMIFEALDLLKDPAFVGRVQVESEVTISKKIEKAEGLIDWNLTCGEICNRYRAFQPWPGVYTFLDGKQVILSGLKECLENTDGTVLRGELGRICFDKKEKILKIRAKDGFVIVSQLKPAGGKMIDAPAFWNGLRHKDGARFTHA